MNKIFPQPILIFAFALVSRAGIEFAPGGGFVENGRPVQLIGNLIYELPTADDYRAFPGEPPDWEWLYETPPNRAQFDRLGFNATGGEVPTDWMRKYRPEPSFWQANRTLDWSIAAGYYKNGLPVWVDYTCAGWSHGGLAHDPKRAPSAAAFSAGDCHFLPYSLVTEEGLSLYREMWQSGARELLRHGVKPFVYELFNEPAYDDRSPAAEAAFRRYLATLPTPRPSVAEAVERRKFNQARFADAVARGKADIRAVDPAARTCFQPLQSVGFYICADIDLLAANRTTDLVVAQTGGGDAWDALLLLAVAGTRPIVDGEAYPGATRASHRARILAEYARGLNGTYYFKWDRRARSVVWKEPDGPARLAEQYPYCALNPASVPPESFAGLKDAARDIAAVNDLFTPRNRGVPATVAVLVSQSTIRLCAAEGRTDAIRMREAGETLLAARLPVKAIFEEQLDADHLKGVKLLVAAGIDATLDTTNARLRHWVEKGGTLVAVGKALDRDEWGRARADAFVPQQKNRRLGKGRVIFVDHPLAPANARAFYAKIANRLGIRPVCRLTDALQGTEVPEIECYSAQNSRNSSGFILLNGGLSPRAVRLLPVAVGAAAQRWTDVTTGLPVPCTARGELLVRLLPGIPVILRGEVGTDPKTVGTGPMATGVKMGTDPQNVGTDPMVGGGKVSENAFFASLPAWLAENNGSDLSSAPYWVEPDSVAFVDLRTVANGTLEKVVASVPWGWQVLAGVPFDLIRFDQNGNRSGVCLDRAVAPVVADGAVRALDFLFTVPTAADGALFTCELAFADGVRETVSVSAPDDVRFVGWRNRDGTPLFVVRKPSPRLDAAVASLGFTGRTKGVWLAAVSLERPPVSSSVCAFQAANLKVGAWGGHVASATDEGLRVRIAADAPDWSGAAAELLTPLALSDGDVANRSLVLDVALGETAHGPVSRPLPVPQFQLGYQTATGEAKRGGFVWPGTSVESGVWRTVRIPLRRLVPADAAKLTRLAIQFRPFGSERADYRFRGLRIE